MASVNISQISVTSNSGSSILKPSEKQSSTAQNTDEEEEEYEFEEEEEYEATFEGDDEEEFTEDEEETEMLEASVQFSEQLEPEEEEQEMEAEGEKKIVPTFKCHEVEGNKQQPLFRSTAAMRKSISTRTQRGGDFGGDEFDEEDEEYSKVPKKGKKYQRLYPDELDYRPAAMAPFPSIIRQITNEVHAEIHRRGCQRQFPDKHKTKTDTSATGGKNAEDDPKARDGMEQKLNRLKIYRRALGSLVIYFRAYAPILVDIKKSYEDMLTYKLRQFKEGQHNKLRIHQEKVAMQVKMACYRFPDHKKLHKSRQYLQLLLTRIHKQDEAIKFITEILSKMERALSDHYEQERDLEDQIKLLDIEIADRREKAMYPMKRFEIESEDNKEDTTEVKNTESNASDSEEEPIDENEEMDEDKRMVLILAYAVCLKDLEEAEKKLRIYENKYQNVSPRHELESMKIKIVEEKDQVKLLLDEREALEQEVLDLTGKNDSVNEELEELREMPEDLRLDAIKKKYAEDKGLMGSAVEEDSSVIDFSDDEQGNELLEDVEDV